MPSINKLSVTLLRDIEEGPIALPAGITMDMPENYARRIAAGGWARINGAAAGGGFAVAKSDGSTVDGSTGSSVSGGIAITGDVTITSANASTYNGKNLIFSTAATVTLSLGLPTDFGFSARPPASGNASIASSNTGGLPTLDGSAATAARNLASNKMFAVVWVAADAYTVTGV